MIAAHGSINFKSLASTRIAISPKLKGSPKTDRLQSLIEKSQATLLIIKSILVFDFVPDKLVVDENKVTIIHKDFWGIRSIHSILIENISYVEVVTGVLSATLHLTDSTNSREPIHLSISNLPRDKAVRARKLIQGLVQARKTNIDFSTFTPRELEYYLEQLGEVGGED